MEEVETAFPHNPGKILSLPDVKIESKCNGDCMSVNVTPIKDNNGNN